MVSDAEFAGGEAVVFGAVQRRDPVSSLGTVIAVDRHGQVLSRKEFSIRGPIVSGPAIDAEPGSRSFIAYNRDLAFRVDLP
jgi:hypothetical protein